MKRKLIKGKINLNKKIILLISIIFVIFIVIFVLVLLFFGNRKSLSNNSVVQDECDYRSGWEKITENGKTYCRFLVRNDYSCPSGYQLDRKNRKCKKIIGYDYDCPNNDYNYIKSGSGKNLVCKRKVQYCESNYSLVGGGSTAYCKSKTGTCPGDSKSSSDGKKCEYTYKEPACDKKGYSLIGGGSSAYCQKNVGKEYYCTGSNFELDKKKGTCTYYTRGPGCSSGYQMVGGGSTAYCIKYTYDCPKNYKSQGTGKNKTCTYNYKERVCKSGWFKVTSNGNDVKCQKDLGKAKNGKCSKGVKEGKRCYLYEKMIVVSKVDKRKAIKTQHTTKVINKIYTNTVSAKSRTKFDYNSKVIQINKKGYTNKTYKTDKVKEKYVTDKTVSTPKYETIKATAHPVYKTKELNVHNSSNEESKKKTIVDNLTDIAKIQVNNGGSEYRKFYWGYDSDSDWCAAFIWWLFNQNNDTKKYIVKDATADGLVRESVNSKLGTWHEDNCYDSNTVPQAGDLIVFDPYYSNNGMYIPYPLRATNQYPPIYGFNTRDQYLSSHIGYVYKVDNNKRIVYTIEGNSSNMVKAKEYSWDFCGKEASDKQRINGYYRPNYK